MPFDETRPGDREARDAAEQQAADISFFANAQDTTSPSTLLPNILAHNSSMDKSKDPSPKKFNFSRVMQFDGIALRFSAILDSDRQLDRDRRFIVSLFPSDDSISVFEPRQRNSGILGGKFMEKSKILKPDGSGQYYQSNDFQLGIFLMCPNLPRWISFPSRAQVCSKERRRLCPQVYRCSSRVVCAIDHFPIGSKLSRLSFVAGLLSEKDFLTPRFFFKSFFKYRD